MSFVLAASPLMQLVSQDALQSCSLFGSELIITATIVLLLLARIAGIDRRLPAGWLAVGGAFLAFVWAWLQFFQLSRGSLEPTTMFAGMAVFDLFTVFFRLFILLYVVFILALAALSGFPDDEDSPDFFTLLLGASIGMMLMASANHLLMLFVGIEMASVPSYALVGFLKGRRQSSEAALKFVVYGAGAAGVMLYGITLIAGLLGTAEFPRLAMSLAEMFRESTGISDPSLRLAALGLVMVLAGFAFKLSIVPFHFWTPDAFHGASAEVGAFLSVASKAGAFALLVRFCVSLFGASEGAASPAFLTVGLAVGVVASLTATFGNLAAYSQTNLKRLLAYSTIAHSGYMLMAVSALVVFLNAPPKDGFTPIELFESSARAIDGLLYYLSVYLFMNLGAFAVVALVRNETFSEELDDYRGIALQSPLLGVVMSLFMFSLVGLPPLAGFAGKFAVFRSVYEATLIHPVMWIPLVAGGLNTVFSLFYYLRVLKVMIMDERPAGAKPVLLTASSPSGAYLLLVSLPVVLLGFVCNQLLADTTSRIALSLFQ